MYERSVSTPYGSIEDHEVIRAKSYDSNWRDSGISPLWVNLRKVIAASTIFMIVALIGVISFSSKVSTFIFGGEMKLGDSSMYITITNEYGDVTDKMFPYPFLENSYFAEMYKNNSIAIVNRDESCDYLYNIEGPIQDFIPTVEFSGSFEDGIAIFTPVRSGQYSFVVSEFCGNNETTIVNSTIWSKYVRRELSDLTDSDREEFLDAFVTLWNVDTVEGQKLYGARYKSLYYFASLHNDAGANSVCDEFHGGNGFVNNHLYLSAYLEQSLQLVNPRVALHYMDYTKYFDSDAFEQHNENQMDGGAWTELLTDKYFGSNNPYTGQIIDGRWANLTLPTLSTLFFAQQGIEAESTFFPSEESDWLDRTDAHISSPYGYLRSPWNWNPNDYVLRYNNVARVDGSNLDSGIFNYYEGVTCDDFHAFIRDNVMNQPMSNFLKTVEDDIHGKIHFTFGGAGGKHCHETDEILKNDYGFTDNDIVVFAQSAQTFFKYYTPLRMSYGPGDGVFPINCTAQPWQNGVLTTTDSPMEGDGPVCSCSDYYFESEENLSDLMTMYFAEFQQTGIPQDTTIDAINNMDFETRKTVMRLLCSRFQFDGEMAGSGAASDPLFWVAHGAVERLMQRVVFENVLADTNYTTSRDTCSGHDPDGTKAWLKGYFFLDESVKVSKLTNVELMNILLPNSDEYRDYINFVYDVDDYSWCSGSSTWFDE